MIARTRRDDAAFAFLGSELGNLIQCAATLERACFLAVLHFASHDEALVRRGQIEERRLKDAPSQTFGCCGDINGIEHAHNLANCRRERTLLLRQCTNGSRDGGKFLRSMMPQGFPRVPEPQDSPGRPFRLTGVAGLGDESGFANAIGRCRVPIARTSRRSTPVRSPPAENASIET